MGMPEHINPTEGISPNVVEWYRRHGRYREYIRTGGKGFNTLARRELEQLDRFVRTEQGDLLKRLLDKRTRPAARSISVKKITAEIVALENGGRP
jgi:hypothetical protein